MNTRTIRFVLVDNDDNNERNNRSSSREWKKSNTRVENWMRQNDDAHTAITMPIVRLLLSSSIALDARRYVCVDRPLRSIETLYISIPTPFEQSLHQSYTHVHASIKYSIHRLTYVVVVQLSYFFLLLLSRTIDWYPREIETIDLLIRITYCC